MEVLKIVMAIMLVFSLVSCKDDPIEEPPLECGENQEEENGVCVIIDQDLEDIKNALEDTQALTNYQIDVVIAYSESAVDYTYEMTLIFDDHLSMFNMNDEDIVYYEKTATGINQYTKQGDVYAKEDVEQIETFDFYRSLDPKWFSKTGDVFILGSQYLTNINDSVSSYFPEGTINNFKIVVGDTYIDSISFDVKNGEVTYQLTFDFSLFETVEIVLPTV